jgi:hypothetical protein
VTHDVALVSTLLRHVPEKARQRHSVAHSTALHRYGKSRVGVLMLNELAWNRVAGRLSEDTFSRQDHPFVFCAIDELQESYRH